MQSDKYRQGGFYTETQKQLLTDCGDKAGGDRQIDAGDGDQV